MKYTVIFVLILVAIWLFLPDIFGGGNNFERYILGKKPIEKEPIIK